MNDDYINNLNKVYKVSFRLPDGTIAWTLAKENSEELAYLNEHKVKLGETCYDLVDINELDKDDVHMMIRWANRAKDYVWESE